VHGFKCRASSFNTQRIDRIFQAPKYRFKLHPRRVKSGLLLAFEEAVLKANYWVRLLGSETDQYFGKDSGT
jgi:hypothetical protein